MKTPLLSVILATKDRAARLPGAIESVLQQTMTDLELIVVDHGSRDDTATIVGAIAERDHRLRYEHLPERSGGPSEARNRGIDLVRGEYVSFVDDDDRWSHDKAEVQIASLRSRPELGGVSCFFEQRDEASGRTLVYRGPTGYAPPSLAWGHFSLGVFVLLRRADYGDELRFDEEILVGEDWDLTWRCARRKPIDTIPRALYEASFHAGQAQASADRRRMGLTTFVRKHEAAMSAGCLAYHRARLEIMTSAGAAERLALGARLASRLPPRITTMIAREAFAARVGRLTGDPGRSLRTLHAMVEGRT